MDTIEAIFARRAVKYYDPNFEIPPKDKAKMLEAIRQTPTSFNIQNYRMVIVEDTNLRQQLREVAWDQAQVTDASLLFVVCADLKAWEQNPKRYWETAPPETQEFLANAILDFYKDRQWQQRDEAMRTAGLAGQTLMLTAKSLGYDSCPMIGFDSDAVGKLVNLPEDHVVCMMISVGKATQEARPKGGYIPDSEVFLTDRFGQ